LNVIQRVATSGHHNSAMIIDQWKFIRSDSCMGCIVSICAVGINSVIPLACTLCTRNLPQIFYVVKLLLTAWQIMLTTVSCRQPVMID